MLHEVAAGAEHEVVADRGGGGGDLVERVGRTVSGAELEVVADARLVGGGGDLAEFAALDVAHVAY